MYNGPYLNNTGLVYGYDTGIGVSTNSVATRLYLGQPTTNLVVSPQGNNNVTTLSDLPNELLQAGLTGYASYSDGYGVFTLALNPVSSTGKTFRYSIWMRSPGGVSTYLMYVFDGTGSDGGWWDFGSGNLTGEWQRFTSSRSNMTGTVTFIRIYRLNQQGTIQIAAPQFEHNSFSTPFVTGTRSSTQSLLDAKRATTIDVSTVSFNSSAQPTFDGTDDYIDFTAPGLGGTTTVELIARIGSGYSGKMIFGWLYYDVWCSGGNMGYNTGNGDLYGISSSTVSSLGIVGNYRHFVFEMRSDTSYTSNKIYVNTVNQSLSQIQSSENAGTRNFNSGNGRISSWRADLNYAMPMDCPVFRVYNRALSANEISQNFQSYRSRFNI
jgi:hypothetical protein